MPFVSPAARIPLESDSGVQSTNDDAQISKLSCVTLGYFDDEFLRFFVSRPSKRPPLINRGYYSRFAALTQLLHGFLDACRDRNLPCQVLSLGAGFDTTFFNLKERGCSPTAYYEVDFQEVTRRKISAIRRNERLRKLLEASAGGAEPQAPEVTDGGRSGGLIAPGYRLLPADLRQLQGLQTQLEAAGFDVRMPTFVLAECVLVYMDPEASTALVRWLGGKLEEAVLVQYEHIRPHDAFGQQMVLNLERRGCGLRGVFQTPTPEAHEERCTANRWTSATARDMLRIYNGFLDPQDLLRIEALETFDEFEEWRLIQEHYCICVARKTRPRTERAADRHRPGAAAEGVAGAGEEEWASRVAGVLEGLDLQPLGGASHAPPAL